MKLTDLFSRIYKGSSSSDGGKVGRLIQPVQPVAHVGKVTLVPGQLIQGEVVGEDVNGLLLLKLAGEIISARTPIKLEMGQKFWFEVSEAGDTPLLNLATKKGAVQELLKDILATRPLLVKTQPGVQLSAPSVLQAETITGGAAPRPEVALPMQPAAEVALGQVPSSPDSGQPQPGSAVVAPDGSLPPEAARLVRALVVYMKQPDVSAAVPKENGVPQSPSLIKTIVALIREGQIPVALQKVEAFQDVIRTRQPITTPLPLDGQGHEPEARGEVPSSAGVVKASSPLPVPSRPASVPSETASAPASPSPPVSAVFTPETIKILNRLVAVAGIKAPMDGEGGPLQPALNPDQNLAEVLTLIAQEDKIPVPLQKLAPLQVLMGTIPGSPLGGMSGALQTGWSSKDKISAEGLPAAPAAFPLQFAAAQQGAEPLPPQLRLLASLMGLGSRGADMEVMQEIEEIFGRLSETELPAAARKLASYFEAHSRVNAEAAPQGQSNFYIMPSLFTGQSGWGEWLWSREHSSDHNDGQGQENLVFFLEMSNLGAMTVQVILKEKKVRGQILMADKKGSELVAALLPGLQERLEAFGYDVVDFPCSCQPLNVMQELKENLHSRSGSGSVSLLDVQA